MAKTSKTDSSNRFPSRRPKHKGSVKSKVAARQAQAHMDRIDRAADIYQRAYDAAWERFRDENQARGSHFDRLCRMQAKRAGDHAVRMSTVE